MKLNRLLLRGMWNASRFIGESVERKMPDILRYPRSLVLIGMFLLGGIVLVPQAQANLNGSVELGYITYDAKRGGNKVLEGSSFAQRYSILYSKSNERERSPFFVYSLALGYEWASFDTELKSPFGTVERDRSEGVLHYQGSIYFDPPNIPVRLTAFIRDLNRIIFETNTQYNDLLNGSNLLIAPSMPSGLLDGDRISAGATLIVGSKAGLPRGSFQWLTYFPLLMLDYRDELLRDLKSNSPVNQRQRRLGFVSLNRKDNWFHFRMFKTDDLLTPINSGTETQVQLGTIDENLRRRWINLTNWISVSADGQFSNVRSNTPGLSYEEYDLNLFGIATRRTWEGKTFINYNRNVNPTYSTNSQFRFPVYLNGIWNLDTDWYLRGERYVRQLKPVAATGVQEVNESLNTAGVRINTFKRAPFTLSSNFTVETRNQPTLSNYLAIQAAVDTVSTPRFSTVYDVGASYALTSIISKDTNGNPNNSLNNALVLRAGVVPSPRVRVDFNQSLTIATGYNTNLYGGNLGPIDPGVGNRPITIKDNYLRSVTALNASYIYDARSSFGLTIGEDYLASSGESDAAFTFGVNARYSGPLVSAGFYSNYALHKNKQYTLQSNASFQYSPNKNISASLSATHGFDNLLGTNQNVNLNERLSYYFFRYRGAFRRYLDLTQSFTINYQKTPFGTQQNEFSLGVAGSFYPTNRLFLSAGVMYYFQKPVHQIYNASLGMNFNLFSASLDYTYGSVDVTKVREQRLAATVRRMFQ